MKWIKHDTDANRDVKLRKLIKRYKGEGYGVYWLCLELIAYDIGPTNLTFELEHDAELIADMLHMHQDQVQEIMKFMVDLGLFENNHGTITCLKLAQRMDSSMTGNSKFRTAIKQLTSPDTVMTESGQSHDSVMNEKREERRENISSDSLDSDTSLFEEFWRLYPKKDSRKKAEMAFRNMAVTKQRLAIQDMKAGRYSDREKRYIPLATTYLHGERWNDEGGSVFESSDSTGSYGVEI